MGTFIVKPRRKVIVAGSRDFNDYGLVCHTLNELFGAFSIEIVSGGARGADRLGEQYADDHWIPKTVFPAEWDKYGKSAGYRRNEQMAQYAEVLVAFWDYNSPGTRHMINLAKQYNLEVHVIDTRKEM
jgi:hypothetical protein